MIIKLNFSDSVMDMMQNLQEFDPVSTSSQLKCKILIVKLIFVMGILPQDEQGFKFQGDKNAGYDVLLTNMKQAATTSKEFHEILLPDVAWPAARSTALCAFCRKRGLIMKRFF